MNVVFNARWNSSDTPGNIIRGIIGTKASRYTEHMQDPNLKAFGERVREARKVKGYSQERFAVLAGLDRSYMGRIERGEINITLLKIHQICEALSLSPASLFESNKD